MEHGPFMEDLPLKMVIFYSYVKLIEGISINIPILFHNHPYKTYQNQRVNLSKACYEDPGGNVPGCHRRRTTEFPGARVQNFIHHLQDGSECMNIISIFATNKRGHIWIYIYIYICTQIFI